MHLSFVLDLPTDDFAPLLDTDYFKETRFSCPPLKGKDTKVAWGSPLTTEGIAQVSQLIDYLMIDQNCQEEGLFRKTGSVIRQAELRALLCAGEIVDLHQGEFSVHDCASVLKSYLHEMEEPLLTQALFQPFMKVVELARQQTLPSILEEVTRKRIKCIQLLFQLLPLYNYHLLKPLLQLLSKVASNKDSTRMDATCLAKLFAPVIMCPKTMTPEEFFTRVQHPAVELLSFIIEQEPVLFKLPDELVQDVIAFIKNEQDEHDHGVVKTQLTFAIRREQSKEEIDDYTTRELARLYAHVSQQPDTTPTKKLFLQRVQQAPSIQPATPRTPIAAKAEKILGLADTPDSLKRGLLRTSIRYPIQGKAAFVRSGSVDSLVAVDLVDKENASPFAKVLKRKADEDHPAGGQMPTPTKFSRTPFQSVIRASMRVKAAVLTPTKKLIANTNNNTAVK